MLSLLLCISSTYSIESFIDSLSYSRKSAAAINTSNQLSQTCLRSSLSFCGYEIDLLRKNQSFFGLFLLLLLLIYFGDLLLFSIKKSCFIWATPSSQCPYQSQNQPVSISPHQSNSNTNLFKSTQPMISFHDVSFFGGVKTPTFASIGMILQCWIHRVFFFLFIPQHKSIDWN